MLELKLKLELEELAIRLPDPTSTPSKSHDSSITGAGIEVMENKRSKQSLGGVVG